MRHRVAHRKLGRVTEHRISLLRNQATALLRHEHIETTVPKARELRPFVERLITVAKRGIAAGDAEKKLMNARRHVAQDLADVKVVDKLFAEVAPRFQARPGGYTRLLKVGPRRGDSADMARIELVGSEYNPNLEAEGEAAAAAPKATGVRGRLQAAASRLRGKRAAAADKQVAEPAPAEPKKRVTKKAAKKTKSGE
jgi:large subunit ribosomal protein L17